MLSSVAETDLPRERYTNEYKNEIIIDPEDLHDIERLVLLQNREGWSCIFIGKDKAIFERRRTVNLLSDGLGVL